MTKGSERGKSLDIEVEVNEQQHQGGRLRVSNRGSRVGPFTLCCIIYLLIGDA